MSNIHKYTLIHLFDFLYHNYLVLYNFVNKQAGFVFVTYRELKLMLTESVNYLRSSVGTLHGVSSSFKRVSTTMFISSFGQKIPPED